MMLWISLINSFLTPVFHKVV